VEAEKERMEVMGCSRCAKRREKLKARLRKLCKKPGKPKASFASVRAQAEESEKLMEKRYGTK